MCVIVDNSNPDRNLEIELENEGEFTLYFAGGHNDCCCSGSSGGVQFYSGSGGMPQAGCGRFVKFLGPTFVERYLCYN